MAKRRTNAEIAEVHTVHAATNAVAWGIFDKANPEANNPEPPAGTQFVQVRAAAYWEYRAEHQRDAADTLVVSFSTKDVALAERVALAIRAAVDAQ